MIREVRLSFALSSSCAVCAPELCGSGGEEAVLRLKINSSQLCKCSA